MKNLNLGHPYLPHSESEVSDMMKTVGIAEITQLFEQIPDDFKVEESPDIPTHSEQALSAHISDLSEKNHAFGENSFLGGGLYRHYIPSAIKNITARGEFFTAYTPYQPEISQGTLQAIFEYQTHICNLTGLDVANASLYDGATATLEAALMACRLTKKNDILVSGTLNREYREVLESYTCNSDYTVTDVEQKGYITDLNDLEGKLEAGNYSCFILQAPNRYGYIEDIEAIAKIVKGKGVELIYSFTEALSLSILKKPSEYGVDIVAGEGQSFGNAVNFGGPLLGVFAADKKYLRHIPGRVVGQTTDKQGKRGFVLTLATREQHIRRERATSNICSNQGLCALSASIYLSLTGKTGLQEFGTQNAKLAAYAFAQLQKLPDVTVPEGAFFNEFVVEVPMNGAELVQRGLGEGIAAGIPLNKLTGSDDDRNKLLLTFTEINSVKSIDRLVNFLLQATSV